MRGPVQLTLKASHDLSKQLRCLIPLRFFTAPSICLRLCTHSCIFCQADRILSNKSAGNLSGGAFKDLSREGDLRSHHHTAHGWRLGDLRPEAGWFPFARRWWAVMDLNQWPLRCQRSALTTELTAPDKNLSDLEAPSQARALETGIIDRHQTPEEPEDI